MTELRRQLGIAFRWSPLIIAGAVLAGGIAVALVSGQRPVYEASVRLRVDAGPNPDLGALMVAREMSAEYARMGSTPDFVEPVISELGLDEGPEAFLRRVTIRPDATDATVTIIARAGSPQEAVRVAEAMSQVLRVAVDGQLDSASRSQVDGYLTEIQEDLTAIQDQMRVLVADPDPERAAELTALRERESELRRDYLALLPFASESIRNRLVPLASATLPDGAVEPRPLFFGTLAAAAGLFLAAALAFVIEYLRDEVRDPSSAEEAAGVPVLASIPEPAAGIKLARAAMPIALGRGVGPAGDGVRGLRASIEAAWVPGSLLVAEVGRGRGRPTIALLLAADLARAGRSVMVIDADLRRPTVHALLDLPGDVGLATVMDRAASITEVARRGAQDGLHIVPAGPPRQRRAARLDAPRFAEVLAEARQAADVVIVVAAPLPRALDAALIGALTDATILVVDGAGTRTSALSRGSRLLQAHGANLIGTVLRATDRRTGQPPVRSLPPGAGSSAA